MSSLVDTATRTLGAREDSLVIDYLAPLKHQSWPHAEDRLIVIGSDTGDKGEFSTIGWFDPDISVIDSIFSENEIHGNDEGLYHSLIEAGFTGVGFFKIRLY